MTTPEFNKAMENLKKVEKFVATNIKSSKQKQEALLNVLSANSEALLISPSSTRTEFHGAFPGGLVEHSLKVLKNLSVLSTSFEAKLPIEEMVVVSLFHDIGKIGDGTNEYYLPKNSSWHADRGIFFEVNPVLSSWKVSQLSLFHLQREGVVLNKDEYMAISSFDQGVRAAEMPSVGEPSLSVLLRQAIGLACYQGKNKTKITL
ncbi:MAG: hypothetical protein E6R04_02280 [Spirochaetes bacterium]|nr:MAG: hypothetical protein E6R04_02280 [Spirochaetota bacterium]